MLGGRGGPGDCSGTFCKSQLIQQQRESQSGDGREVQGGSDASVWCGGREKAAPFTLPCDLKHQDHRPEDY